MEQNVGLPAWLNQTFIVTVLEKSCGKNANDSLKVINFTIAPATAPGNNYMSNIYRVKVEFEEGVPPKHNVKSFIVKVPLADGFMKDLNDSNNCFEREPKMYGEMLPNLYAKANCCFGPKSFLSSIKNVLVLEDLKEEGYSVQNKFKQLDYMHCKLVIENLAKFHASSVAFFHENPNLMQDVGRELIFTEGNPIEPMLKPSMEHTVKVVNEMKGLEEFSEYLAKRVDHFWSLTMKAIKPKPDGGFNVLNHGDLWTNNLLFKYNQSGGVVDVKFIDFQFTRIRSPVIDLLYFLWSSANDDVRAKRQKTLFGIYLCTLNDSLERLGCKERLSREELFSDIEMAADWALFTIAHQLPFFMADGTDVPDFADTSVDYFQSEAFLKVYKGKPFNNILTKVIRDYVDFFFKPNNLTV